MCCSRACVYRATAAAELQTLVQTISERIGRRLERTGKLVRDDESSYLTQDSDGEGEDAVLKDLQGHSIQYRIAVGPHKGRKAFMLQSLPPLTGDRAGESLAKAAAAELRRSSTHGYGRLVSFGATPSSSASNTAGTQRGQPSTASDVLVYRQGVQSPERNSSSTELTFSGCSCWIQWPQFFSTTDGRALGACALNSRMAA